MTKGYSNRLWGALCAAAAFLTAIQSADAQTTTFPPGDVPAAPDDGGYRYFEVATASGALRMREGPGTQSPVAGSLPAATILTNLGCQAVEGHAWCDVQPLGGGPRGYVAAEFLKPGGSRLAGMAPTGFDDSAARAGEGNFDATGVLNCAKGSAPLAMACDFGVARAGGGDAAVSVARPGGGRRAIFLALGTPIGADTSQADWGEFSATRAGDVWTVTIGDERFELPDAIAFGG